MTEGITPMDIAKNVNVPTLFNWGTVTAFCVGLTRLAAAALAFKLYEMHQGGGAMLFATYAVGGQGVDVGKVAAQICAAWKAPGPS